MLAAIRREPALAAGLVSAILALIVAFGVDLTDKQTGAIMAAVAAVLALVVRTQVTPTVAVEARREHGETIAGPAADLVPEGETAVVLPERDTHPGASGDDQQ